MKKKALTRRALRVLLRIADAIEDAGLRDVEIVATKGYFGETLATLSDDEILDLIDFRNAVRDAGVEAVAELMQ